MQYFERKSLRMHKEDSCQNVRTKNIELNNSLLRSILLDDHPPRWNRTTQTMPKIFTHDFLLVFLAQFTFTFVFHILIPTLPIYLSRLGSTETEIGVLIGIFFFSSLVLRPFVGRALLKTPEKTFMIAGALLFALTSSQNPPSMKPLKWWLIILIDVSIQNQ